METCGRLLIAGATARPWDFDHSRQPRKALVLDWATERLAAHHCFMSVVLFGMHNISGSALCMIGAVLEVRVLIAQFLDIQMGQDLRNLRAITSALQDLGEEVGTGGTAPEPEL